MKPEINIHNRDCLEAMAEMPDNAYELAIVDPPYGIENRISIGGGSHTKTKTKFHNLYSEHNKKWDVKPPKQFFSELQRVCKNQIVCGGNYFADFLPVSRGWVYWHKQGENMSSVNDELIWTSFTINPKMFSRFHGLDKGFITQEKKIHPTQKPVALYKWLLKNYANEGDQILDTHFGSGSIAIACHDYGFNLTGFEIDEEYYKAALDRLNTHRSQMQLF